MKRSRPTEKRGEAKPDPRQRPLFEGWSARTPPIREPRTGETLRAESGAPEER